MKSAMRIALILVFCLIYSSFAFPQEKSNKKDKNPAPVQTAAPSTPCANKTSSGVWPGRRHASETETNKNHVFE